MCSYFFVVFHERSNGAELEHEVGPEDLPSGLALECGLMTAETQVQFIDAFLDAIRSRHVAFFVD